MNEITWGNPPPVPPVDMSHVVVQPTQIDPTQLDEREIVRRLGHPVINSGPWYSCPVCFYSSKRPGIGPHIMGHWKQLDLGHASRPKGTDPVVCPECDLNTTRRLLPGHMVNVHHVERRTANGIARTLGFDLDKARAIPKPKASQARSPNYLPEPVECPIGGCSHESPNKAGLGRHLHNHGVLDAAERDRLFDLAVKNGKAVGESRQTAVEPEPEPHESISATDAALAVIMSQVNGMIPSSMLPDVVEYIDLTRRLVERLKETTA